MWHTVARNRVWPLVLPLVLVTGCGWIPQAKPGTESGPDGELLVASRTAPGNAQMQALFEGTVFLNEGSCVAGRTVEGYEVAMLFPRGSSFADGDELVIRSGNHEIALNEPVALGGGFASLPEGHLDEVPESCKYDETFTVQSFGSPSPTPSSMD